MSSTTSTSSVFERVSAEGALPLFTHDDPTVACELARVTCEGGFTTLEFLNRSSSSFEVFLALKTFCDTNLPTLLLGVGSITSAEAAQRFLDAGAQFVVAPAVLPRLATVCREKKVTYIPGCGTVTEMLTAQDLGCQLLKAFPADCLGGPRFIKSVRGPCPFLKLMPTGGVDISEENLTAWFKAGVVCVGLGSDLYSAPLVSSKNFAEIRQRAQLAATRIAAIRALLSGAKIQSP